MRKKRAGELEEEALQGIIKRVDADWAELFIIELHDELLPLAKDLIRKYPLKGADSIHLASALWLAGTAKGDLTFIASDINLLNAAIKEKLETLNPQ